MPPEPQRTKRLPIYRNAGFLFDTIGEAADVFAREEEYPQSADRFSYSRYGNPNVAETEEQLAEIEGAEWAVLTASGMAAIDSALSVFQRGEKTGPWLFFSELYGGTNDYIQNILIGRRGIDVVRFHPAEGEERYDLDRLDDLLERVKPALLYFEPVTNPLLIVSDGGRVIEMAKERGIGVIVDNTFATSRLWRPLERGADIVVHSATKYLGGHGNLTAGVVCGNDYGIRKDAMLYRKYVGNILSPDDAYRLNTQSRTFGLRFAAQCENASKLADGHVRPSRRRARPLSRPRFSPDPRRGREDVRRAGFRRDGKRRFQGRARGCGRLRRGRLRHRCPMSRRWAIPRRSCSTSPRSGARSASPIRE